MKIRSSLIAFATLSLGTALSHAAVETYAIDPVHSSVAFKIRHLVSKLPGKFTKFNGTLTVDRDNLENSSADATIEVTSINTGNEKRDTHLRSADFFDAATFPKISFKSKSWKKTGAETFDVTGDLTIKDVTKEVILKVTVLGFGPGPQGGQVSGWEGSATINKADFHVKDPPALDTMIGDDVEILLNVEADMKK